MTTAIIHARLGSKRLSRKVMRKIGAFPMLYHVVRQVRASRLIDEIIVGTIIGSSGNQDASIALHGDRVAEFMTAANRCGDDAITATETRIFGTIAVIAD